MGRGVATMTRPSAARARVGAAASQAMTARDRAVAIADSPDAGRFGGDLLSFLGEREPSHEPAALYWCDGLIVRGEPMLILGEPKVGKTLLVEDLALCLAVGAPDFCGQRIYQRARVLLMPREDSARETSARLWQIARARGVHHRDLVGWLEIDAVSPLFFDRPDSVSAFRTALARFDVAIIDSLSTIHSTGDENSNGAMSPAMAAWRDLCLRDDKTVALVHHLRKPGEGAAGRGTGAKLSRSRGASIIAATARHAVVVTNGLAPDQVLLTIEGNHARMPPPLVVARRSGTGAEGAWVSHARIGDLAEARRAANAAGLAQRIVELLSARAEPVTRNAIADELGGNRQNTLAAIGKLVASGVLVGTESDDLRESPVLLADTARQHGYQPPAAPTPGGRWSRP